MAYSCTDFVDTILDALGIEVPEEAWDDPAAQADLALEAIEKLRTEAEDSRNAVAALRPRT